jgi:uncharacterized protein involved in exopolysaccharide biosynthesis
MTNEEIQQQIDALTQQITQRANQLAGQDPFISRLSGQIEVYRTLIESETADVEVGANSEVGE